MQGMSQNFFFLGFFISNFSELNLGFLLSIMEISKSKGAMAPAPDWYIIYQHKIQKRKSYLPTYYKD